MVDNGIIHSTDDIIESIGDYNQFFKDMVEFKDFTPLSRAHSTNLKNAIKSMEEGISKVIIDNTNIKANEAKAYVKKALELGYSEDNIIIFDIGTNNLSAEELAKRNTHNVPLEKIEQMIQTYKSVGPLTVKKILESKDFYKESDVLYSCVLLDNASKNLLIERMDGMVHKDWQKYCEHMTINLGALKDKSSLGKKVMLTVTHFGFSNTNEAVKVKGFPSSNAIPHITVTVNPDGGLPKMSNEIVNWMEIKNFDLIGVVTEIKR